MSTTVIIGAGIIGTSTAYYLSQTSKNAIHLVEASPQLFASASGYAAGFLARDWFSPSLSALGELSFDLHKKLAEENDGHERWGYSRSTGTNLAETVGKNGADWLMEGVSRSTAAARTSKSNGNRPAWLSDGPDLDVMSDGSTTAQCDPLLLCQFLMESCQSRGVRLHQPAKAISITRSPSGTLSDITICNTITQEQTTIPCTRLVLAAGAWTPQVHRTLFPNSKTTIPITSLAGHSLVLRSPHWPPPPPPTAPENNNSTDPAANDCHAVFTTDTEANYSPEIFSRLPSGTIYLAGLNSRTYPLPPTADSRVVDAESVAVLKRTAKRLLRGGFEVVREGVCWRPVARRGVPIIGELGDGGGEEEEGVIVCAGHGPWGISNSLGSGFCVARMVEGGDVGRFVGGLGL